MTIPSNDELAKIAQDEVWSQTSHMFTIDTWNEWVVANADEVNVIIASSIKRSVIEALAEEAETDRDWVLEGGDAVALWLRSHLADDHEPVIEGYTFLGRGRMHDDLPVYQKDVDSSLWIKTEGEMIPYSMTFDHTNGLGRVKG